MKDFNWYRLFLFLCVIICVDIAMAPLDLPWWRVLFLKMAFLFAMLSFTKDEA